jgi:hypothetical protein
LASVVGSSFLQEAGRGVDQFVEVFQPLLAFLLGQVVLAQAAFSITWSITSGSGRFSVSAAQGFDQADEGRRPTPGLAGQARGGVVEAGIGAVRGFLQASMLRRRCRASGN